MKKIFFLILFFAMTCEKVYTDMFSIIQRCENEEIVCYTQSNSGGMVCKFKNK